MADEQQGQRDDDSKDVRYWARREYILMTAVTALAMDHSGEFAKRIAYCLRTGDVGVHEMTRPGGDTRLVWGGDTLVVIRPQVFDDDAYFEGLDFRSNDPSAG